MSYYIFDIDGTLADTEHRSQYVKPPPGQKKDWKSFFHHDNMMKDTPIHAVVDLLQKTAVLGGDPIYCTARPRDLFKSTVEWLKQHVEYDMDFCSPIEERIYMRDERDFRGDDIIKPELITQIIAKHGKPHGMFEDRARVVKAVRAMGIRVFQVADGEF